MTARFDDCACGTCATCNTPSAARQVADARLFRHGAIKARLLSRITSAAVDGSRPLDRLGTRDNDDPAIALIDAVAGALHVLAWNAARLADDGTIRRTEDPDALVDLARLLGYEPRPALAAITTLAFTIDPLGGAKATTVPKGTKVASVPQKDESPQIFETDGDLDARVDWNTLLPVQVKSTPSISVGTTSVTIAGASTLAKPGDVFVAYVGPRTKRPFRFFNVTPRPLYPGQNFTVVIQLADPAPTGGLQLQLAADPSYAVTFSGSGTLVIPAGATQGLEMGTVTGPSGPRKMTVSSGAVSETIDFFAPPVDAWLCARIATVTRRPDLDPQRTVIDLASPVGLPVSSGVLVYDVEDKVVILGQHAAAFGATAPDITLMPSTVQDTYGEKDAQGKLTGEWKDLVMPLGDASGGEVDLDAVYADAISGRLVVFAADVTRLGQIGGSMERTKRGFGLSAKVTRIDVRGIDLGNTGFRKKVRETAIYVETARETPLVVVEDVPMPMPSDRLIVQGPVSLPAGRRIVLSDQPAVKEAGSRARIAEVAVLKSSTPSGADTLLVFDGPVATTFRSTTLTLFANAVAASHGETPTTGPEPIGSGDAASPSPTFTLTRSPLAYVPADNLRGYAPAIEVRVDDTLYKEVPTLFDLGTDDRAYAVRRAREEKSAIQFAGRLRSGTHNITALYRTGGGTVGNVGPDRITTIMTPVLGVRTVTNPVPADGASDAETIADMRTAAPQSIRTLDRVVSLADFEAFARTYRGVGKALATELRVGMRKVVCLTIATTTLSAPGADLVDPLRKALAKISVPGRTIRIAGFTDLTADVTVALAIDPTRRRKNVENAVRTMIGERFGRRARRFGEALHRSAVLAALQSVDGVIAARLPVFEVPGGPPEDEGRLLCPAPSIVDGVFIEAGLLSIDPDVVQFMEMVP
jgi:hypothetical protein